MIIALGSDHAGLKLRSEVVAYLQQLGHTVMDFGTYTADSVDYPNYAAQVATAVSGGKAELGVLVCGTGIGMSMAANRFAGVRAALCTHEFMAEMARAHNDANVLCMGERVVGAGVALAMVKAFVNTPFAGGRHTRRVEQLTALESKS